MFETILRLHGVLLSHGRVFFHTALPVKGFVYSPVIAILFALFVPLGSGTAILSWGILQGIFILLYVALFHRLIPSGQWIQLLLVFLALSSFPLLHNLAWGQVGIITTVLILGVLFLYERDQRPLAAILLAFGIGFKFFPLIFLLPFVIRRDVQFLLYSFIACAALLFVIPVSLLGMDGATRFYDALFASYRHFDWVQSNYNSQHFPHVITRLIKAAGPDVYESLAPQAEAAGTHISAYLLLLRWIGYGIAAINTGFIYMIQRARLPHANLWSFHILFLTIPFVLFTSWPSDLVYISFAQGLLAWQLLEKKKNINKTWYATLILVIASSILSNIIFFNIVGNSHGYGYYGAIFWTVLLLLLASYMQLLPCVLRQIQRAVTRLFRQPVLSCQPDPSSRQEFAVDRN